MKNRIWQVGPALSPGNRGTVVRRAVLAIGLAVVLSNLPAPPAWSESAHESSASSTCGACHEDETRQWEASPHAKAISPAFLTEWENEGKKWECLVCHTSQYDRKTRQFSREGVSCESCHGALNENHPLEAKMALPVASEVCNACHSITYGEWRISAHGQKNIRCFDCHKMHQMGLRKDDPDQMCGTCHSERLKDFSHATHRIKGLHCITCHMPQAPGVRTKMEGTGVRGHTFGVGAETCAECHREMVHQSNEVASLEQKVERLEAVNPQESSQQLAELERKDNEMNRRLETNRRMLPWVLGLSFVLGGALGLAIARFPRRTGGPRGGPTPPAGGPFR